MYQTIPLMPGVTLRCVEAKRFKQGCLSIHFIRPMRREDVSVNTLIPSILLRGTVRHPDIRVIIQHLDDLYGASVGEVVRRTGDYLSVGLYFGFIEDRFAFAGDRVLEHVLDFAKELLLEPLIEDGGFSNDYVEGEKRNLITNIENQLNDKRAYASWQLMQKMCSADSFGIPRFGTKEDVQAITPVSAYEHYCRMLKESPVEVFYVGSADPEMIASKIREIFSSVNRCPVALPEQTLFQDGGGGDYEETMEISQGRLCMGFITPVAISHKDYIVMQIFNHLFGGGMTSKLFNQVREKMSLCYAIGSGYIGAKGIVTVNAGVDSDKCELVKQEVLHQLQLCCDGEITETELTAAKEALLSSLRGVYDSSGSIESFEYSMAMSNLNFTQDEYIRRVQSVTLEQVIETAKSLKLHTTFFLKGVDA